MNQSYVILTFSSDGTYAKLENLDFGVYLILEISGRNLNIQVQGKFGNIVDTTVPLASDISLQLKSVTIELIRQFNRSMKEMTDTYFSDKSSMFSLFSEDGQRNFAKWLDWGRRNINIAITKAAKKVR